MPENPGCVGSPAGGLRGSPPHLKTGGRTTHPGSWDAIVVGAGPNGLSAAITLARAGRSVLVLEAQPTVGGGARSAELTLPGFIHDLGSAIHPAAAASPVFRNLPLASHGLEFVHPAVPLAHPLDGGRAAVLRRSVDDTAEGLGRGDGWAYRRLMGRFAREASAFTDKGLDPRRALGLSAAVAQFGVQGARSAAGLCAALFDDAPASALIAGSAAHSMLPLERSPSAGIGLVLGTLAHAVGWPAPRGGAQRLADALAAHLVELGGEIHTDCPVDSLADLPPARAVLCDVTPRQLLHIAGDRLPTRYRRQLERYRYGPGIFKVDWALDGPIPWSAPECAKAGTVHLGGTLVEIAAGEDEVWRGRHPQRPFVLLAQQTVFDPTRAPAGKHTAWAYCHVPSGSPVDMTQVMEAQVERFAPGFRDLVLARAVAGPAALERQNFNLVGGDINAGVLDLPQLVARPALRPLPWTTPVPGLYLCSASTPPGGAVHGLCGYLAARLALRREGPAGPSRRHGASRGPARPRG